MQISLFKRSQPIQFSCAQEIGDEFTRIDRCLGVNGSLFAEFERLQDQMQFWHFEQGMFYKSAFVILSIHSNQIKSITGFVQDNTGNISFLKNNCVNIDYSGENKLKKLQTYINNLVLFKKTVEGDLDIDLFVYGCGQNYINRYFYNSLLENISAKSAKIRFPWRLELKPYTQMNNHTYYNIFGDDKGFLKRESYNYDNASIVIEANEELPKWCYSNSSLLELSIWMEHKTKQIFQDSFKNQCQKLYQEFLSGLNPVALAKAREVRQNDLNNNPASRLYNWFKGKDDPKKITWRIQAYDSFPVPLLVCINHGVKSITKAIDQGKPLLPELERLFSIPKTVLKDLKKLDYDRSLRIMSMMEKQVLFNSGTYSVNNFDLKQIASKNWPAKGRKISMDQQWLQFFRLIDAKTHWVRIFVNTPVYSQYTCLFRNMEETMCAKPIEISDIHGVSDMMKSFVRQCLFGAVYDTDHLIEWLDAVDILSEPLNGTSIIDQALTKNLAPLAVIALSKEWHQRRENIEQIINSTKVPTDYVWPAIVGDQSTRDYQIIPLTSRMQLQGEGEELQHCVANYAENCALGKSAIFSIKKTGRSIATLELSINQNDRLVSIKQLQGLRNSRVEPVINDISVWLQEKINSGEIQVDWENNLQNYRLATKLVAEQSLVDTIGYDPSNRQTRERVFEAWKPILPRNVRELSYDQWIASLSVDYTRAKLKKQRKFKCLKNMVPNTLYALKRFKRL